MKTDEELREIARSINRCFANGCGCCAGGEEDHNYPAAIAILRQLENHTQLDKT